MLKAYSTSNTLLHRGLIASIASFFVLIALIFQANAQEVLAQVQSTADGVVSDGSKSQKKIDKLDDQTAELVMEYRASVRQLEELREFNAQLEKLIAAWVLRLCDQRKSGPMPASFASVPRSNCKWVIRTLCGRGN